MSRNLLAVAAAAALALVGMQTPAAAQTKEITFWSHWAAEKPKREFVEDAIAALRGQEPRHQDQGDVVREDRALCRAQDGAAGRHRRPTSSTPSPTRSSTWTTASCSICRPSTGRNVEPWAKEAWTYKGKPYGLPLEAWTVELYYNKKMLPISA